MALVFVSAGVIYQQGQTVVGRGGQAEAAAGVNVVAGAIDQSGDSLVPGARLADFAQQQIAIVAGVVFEKTDRLMSGESPGRNASRSTGRFPHGRPERPSRSSIRPLVRSCRLRRCHRRLRRRAARRRPRRGCGIRRRNLVRKRRRRLGWHSWSGRDRRNNNGHRRLDRSVRRIRRACPCPGHNGGRHSDPSPWSSINKPTPHKATPCV